MKKIISRQNSEIKALAKLTSHKERMRTQKFIAQGLRTCKTISEVISAEQIYCTQENLKETKNFAEKDKITIVSDHVMEKISSAKTPSGIVGVFSIPPKVNPDKISSGIVLVGVSDPGNMGTLIRTCAAMGFKTAVIVDGADPWGPKVVQASAGQIVHVHIFKISWETLVESTNKNKLKLIALVVKNGKTTSELDFKNTLLVVGSEAHGLSAEVIKACDESLTLPMPGKTESLNVAIAGSIALYLASHIS